MLRGQSEGTFVARCAILDSGHSLSREVIFTLHLKPLNEPALQRVSEGTPILA